MNSPFKITTLALSLALAACGGGGGGDAAPENEDLADPILLSVGGLIQFAPNLVSESDTNNSEDTAQLLPNNLVQVQGFVASDEVDFYRVFLQQGQTITLEGTELSLSVSDVASSFQSQASTGKVQTIEAIADTEYFIEVRANQGASKYVLTLGAVTPQINSAVVAAAATGGHNLGSPVSLSNPTSAPKLALRQAIVKWQSDADSWQFETVDLPGMYNSDNLDWSNEATTLAAIHRLNQREDVAYAEPNYHRQPQALVPNDPLFGAPLEIPLFSTLNGQVDLSQIVDTIAINENNNAGLVVDSRFISQFHYEQIGLPQAWEAIVETGKQPGEDVIVAVADTGIFLDHEDLTNKLSNDGFDFISNASVAKDNESDGLLGDIDSNPDDPGDGPDIASSSWHGTHVAGTIAAETNNNVGLAGVAWETQIMPLRVLGEGGGLNNDIMNSLLYAADLFDDLKPLQQAHIVNLSLGGSEPSQAEQEVIDAVRAQGLFIVASAGNDGNDGLSFPASYDGVISVAAVNGQKQRAFYSQFNPQVDVTAPGGEFLGVNNNANLVACVGVLSSYVTEGNSSGARESSTNCLQGTSMSAPHVSGVIALMKSIYPQLTPEEFDTLLASGEISDDLGTPGRDDEFGHGLINAEKAVQAALKLAQNQPLENPLLSADLDLVELDDNRDRVSFELLNSNSAAQNPSVTVETSADWIEIDDSETSNGIGTYQISANTNGFGTGNYQGLIRFTPSQGNTVELDVALTVGVPENSHPQAPHFVLFVDQEGNTQTTANVQDNGRYQAQLEPGAYRVVSGTDIDLDQVVCQVGETCGTPTSLLDGEVLNLNSDQDQLNFAVELLQADTAQPALFELSELQQQHGVFAVGR